MAHAKSPKRLNLVANLSSRETCDMTTFPELDVVLSRVVKHSNEDPGFPDTTLHNRHKQKKLHQAL
jgi:hypothetical protein